MVDCKDKKRAIFLTFVCEEEGNGIYKKIVAQNKALINNGIVTDFIYQKRGVNKELHFKNNGEIFATIKGHNDFSLFYQKLYSYIKEESIKLIFIRYAFNASPLLNNFFKKCKELGCKIVLEIPTYPYDGEFSKGNLKENINYYKEKFFRKFLYKYIDKIITYSTDKNIFNIPTINISNAVDKDYIKLNSEIKLQDSLHLIGVANLNFWHGYDRLIKGIFSYYESKPRQKVYFHIVGNGNIKTYNELQKLISDYNLQDYIFLEGSKEGEELDKIFAISHIAIGCLGCHRKNINEVKSLKNVEYAMRGIPMVYSENNNDFDFQNYVLKVPANDSDIDVKLIWEFINKNKFQPETIRASVNHLTWDYQINIILNNLNLNK